MHMVEVKFGADGLIPVVAQDRENGQVLMVAYMNRDALARTVATGNVWYWSRSRQTLWRKGEESGHTQRVRGLQIDCDADAILLQVDQRGAACHTGHRTCFYRDGEGWEIAETAGRPGGDILEELFELLRQRRREMPTGSYTSSLLKEGRAKIAGKVLEEAEELTRAAREESEQRVVEEAADLLYHSWLLLVERGVDLSAVRRELERRRYGG